MFKSLVNAWKIDDLRKKMLFTLLIIVIYRLGSNVMVPFINYNYVEMVSTSQLGIFNILGGSAFSQATLFALGVSPYITTSIIMQLLAVAIPALERLSKSEDGKQKMAAITRYVTILISIVTAIGYYLMLKNYTFMNVIQLSLTKDYGSKGANFFIAVVIIACFVAGSSLVMWLAEKVNEKGIGNGVSIILFVNIISRAPQMLQEIISVIKVSNKPYANGYSSGYGFTAETSFLAGGLAYVIGMSLFVLFLLWFIIHFSDSERRIPIQYAKRVVGRKMYGGQNTNLPIKLNMAGVMPIIFASSILGIPQMVYMFLSVERKQGFNAFWAGFFGQFLNGTSITLIILNLVLILAFAYFYVAISFNPNEVAGNLQQNGGSIPGIRPGRPTADFIKRVLSKITFIGAMFLAVIAVIPLIIQLVVNTISPVIPFYVSDFVQSGTSIIIVVGVILETLREIESQLSMRHYKGFLE
jgi:preprotein translocase subunit SecY